MPQAPSSSLVVAGRNHRNNLQLSVAYQQQQSTNSYILNSVIEQIAVKWDHFGHKRRFTVVRSANKTLYQSLKDKIQTMMPDFNGLIAWKDQDQDNIIIGSEEELRLALTNMKSPNQLLIYTVRAHTDNDPPPYRSPPPPYRDALGRSVPATSIPTTYPWQSTLSTILVQPRGVSGYRNHRRRLWPAWSTSQNWTSPLSACFRRFI